LSILIDFGDEIQVAQVDDPDEQEIYPISRCLVMLYLILFEEFLQCKMLSIKRVYIIFFVETFEVSVINFGPI
jgi:hypothetical protein